MFSTSAPIHRRQSLALLAGTACAIGAPPALAQARRVKYILSIPTMSPIVANQTSVPTALGYFEEEGIRLDPVLAGAAGIVGATQLVASGDQDIGSGSYFPLLTRASEGQDMGLSFFYLQVRSYAMAIAVNDDSPVKSIDDLRGKLIGVSTLASEGVPVSKFVARNAGMSEAEFKFIAIGAGAQAAQAMRSRQVEAYAGPRSQIAQAEVAGLKLRYLPLPSRLRDLFGVGLFARRDFLAKNRATVVAVGRAVAKGTLFVISNPEAAIRLHWKAYPQQVPQGLPFEQALANARSTLDVQLASVRFQEYEKVDRFGEYRPESTAALLDVFGWKLPDPQRYFTNDLIAEINAFDRNKVIEQARAFKVS